MNAPDLIDQNFKLHATWIPEQAIEMRVFHLDNLSFVDSVLSCDTFNIIHIHNGELISKEEIKEPLDYFRKRDLEYCIWVNDRNLTDNLSACFTELSIEYQAEEVGMAIELETYKPIKSEKHPHISAVDSIRKLEDYSNVIAANWNPPDKNILSYYNTTSELYLQDKNNIILLVYYEGKKPLATIELFPSDGTTIGIYGLATLEDARGKGIGSALMTMALNKAKELNYKYAVLQASEDGLGIYKRLGFKDYTKYFEYA